MDLQTAVRVALRDWWLIALAVALTAGGSAFFVSRQEAVYQAAATVELKPSARLEEANQILYALDTLSGDRTMLNTIARKATSSTLMDAAASKLNLPQAVVEGSNLSAVVLPDTNLIEIRTESAHPDLAAAISDTVAEELTSQTPDGALALEVVEAAMSPETPISPKPIRTITLGVVFGLVLGAIGAFLEHTIRGSRAQRGIQSLGTTDDLSTWPPEVRRPFAVPSTYAPAGTMGAGSHTATTPIIPPAHPADTGVPVLGFDREGSISLDDMSAKRPVAGSSLRRE